MASNFLKWSSNFANAVVARIASNVNIQVNLYMAPRYKGDHCIEKIFILERENFGLTDKNEWDTLFTDQDIRDRNGIYVPCAGYARRPNFTPENPQRIAERYQISSSFRSVGARYGAHSMIVRRSGMKKILEFVKKYKIFLPYDMEWQNLPDLRMFTVLDDIVTNLKDSLSDNGQPFYKQKNEPNQ